MTSDGTTPLSVKANDYLVAPRRSRPRGWLHRRRSTRRGQFELALIGGGALALALAAMLPGATLTTFVAALTVAGLLMTLVARAVGLAPALAAAVFAPLVIALTDPMWTLGATIADFTLAEESEAAFATFLAAAVIGSGLRRWNRRRRGAESGSTGRGRV